MLLLFVEPCSYWIYNLTWLTALLWVQDERWIWCQRMMSNSYLSFGRKLRRRLTGGFRCCLSQQLLAIWPTFSRLPVSPNPILPLYNFQAFCAKPAVMKYEKYASHTIWWWSLISMRTASKRERASLSEDLKFVRIAFKSVRARFAIVGAASDLLLQIIHRSIQQLLWSQVLA